MLTASLFLNALLAASALAAPSMIKKRETHLVKVGVNNELRFEPTAIFANPGDLVQFQFQSKNHSVVQSSLKAPCAPLTGGFNSGFNLVANGTAENALPIVEYTVVTQKETALWFYCSQAAHTANSHCHAAMVFSINCGGTGSANSFETFESLAKADAAATEPATAVASATDVIVPLTPEPTYAGITIPAQVAVETKTDIITLGTSTWTTTYASYAGSPNPTPNAEDGNEIHITVGKDSQLLFDPDHVIAKPRDKLIFTFYGKNHSVVQSSFASPCNPLRTAQGAWGIDSGFFPVADGQTNPTFTIRVNDTTPLFFYCSQAGGTANAHCGKGMVFSTNLADDSTRSPAAFKALAQQINGTASSNTTGGGSTGGGYGGPDGAVGLGFSGMTFAAVIAAVATFVL